jgi:hypothetical protein
MHYTYTDGIHPDYLSCALPIGDRVRSVKSEWSREGGVSYWIHTHQTWACAVRSKLPPVQGPKEDLFNMLFRCSD